MTTSSLLTCRFHVERSVHGVVTLTVKTQPASRLGGLGAFLVMAAGLFLTAILGSYSDDIRASAGPTLTLLLGCLATAGVGLTLFVAWSARKTSGSLSIDPATRTLSHTGLEWLFVSPQVQWPPEAVIGLDAISIRVRRHGESGQHAIVKVRLWWLPADGRSTDALTRLVDEHRHATGSSVFESEAEAPLPAGATLLGTAFENPIYRRLVSLLVECGAGTAYDATGASTARISDRPPRFANSGAPHTFVIPSMGSLMKIFATLFATMVIGVISLLSLNPFLFVYLWLLMFIALSRRQVLTLDVSGVRLQQTYLFGLWSGAPSERRWSEITAMQVEKAPNGALCLSIRREDGDTLQVLLPGMRVADAIEQRIKQVTL